MKPNFINTAIVAMILVCTSVSGQVPEKEILMIRDVLEKNHYHPRTIDDKLSEEVFSNFINMLDPRNLYFTENEFEKLTAYKTQLDEEILGMSWKFIPTVVTLYKQRLQHTSSLLDKLLNSPLNYASTEILELPQNDSLHFTTDNKEHESAWNKWLKFKILWQLSEIAPANATDAELMKNEPAVRQKIKLVEKRKINRILEHPEGFENYIFNLFYNSLLLCYDPHSNYFSKTEMENFQSELSREGYAFGIDLEETEEGDLKIVRLLPGGPAWKTNELHKGDILTHVQWEGKESIDLAGADMTEVERIFGMSNTGRLLATVRKTDGTVKSVVLVKEKIREEDNIVKSFVLQGDKKIGYISLPGFYTEWENTSGLGCSNDVAKEIIKLKKEGIEGLILDMRYNGGGSLVEGLNLAGIFINEGPLFMLQSKDKKPMVMKDLNRGTVYNGPLVVMINGQSASAAEVVASTLQDFNRALIVGSPSFGKATGQIILPVDSMLDMNAAEISAAKSDHGFLTVTVHKLYRVTGKSAQLRGVIPDIYLPDVYELLDYRESAHPSALPFDSVTKKVYYQPWAALPCKSLRALSEERLRVNKDFQAIQTVIREKKKYAPSVLKYTLNLKSIRKAAETEQQFFSFLQSADITISSSFKADNTSLDKELLTLDEYSKEINEKLIENITLDIYIDETYHIIRDLINETK